MWEKLNILILIYKHLSEPMICINAINMCLWYWTMLCSLHTSVNFWSLWTRLRFHMLSLPEPFFAHSLVWSLHRIIKTDISEMTTKPSFVYVTTFHSHESPWWHPASLRCHTGSVRFMMSSTLTVVRQVCMIFLLQLCCLPLCDICSAASAVKVSAVVKAFDPASTSSSLFGSYKCTFFLLLSWFVEAVMNWNDLISLTQQHLNKPCVSTLLIFFTQICSGHCRFCLRGLFSGSAQLPQQIYCSMCAERSVAVCRP